MSSKQTNLLQGTLDLLNSEDAWPGRTPRFGHFAAHRANHTRDISHQAWFVISGPSPHGGSRLAEFLLGRIGK